MSNTTYEGPAKSFVTGFGLLQCCVLLNIFLSQNFYNSIPPLLKHIFVTVLPSREKQINSLLLVSVGDTDKIALPRELLDVYLFPVSIFLSLGNKKMSQGLRSGK